MLKHAQLESMPTMQQNLVLLVIIYVQLAVEENKQNVYLVNQIDI